MEVVLLMLQELNRCYISEKVVHLIFFNCPLFLIFWDTTWGCHSTFYTDGILEIYFPVTTPSLKFNFHNLHFKLTSNFWIWMAFLYFSLEICIEICFVCLFVFKSKLFNEGIYIYTLQYSSMKVFVVSNECIISQLLNL